MIYTEEDSMKDVYKKLPPALKTSLDGKVTIVIGANIGIGLETARHFASMNAAKVILGCRSKEKGEAAVKDIQESTGNTNVELKIIDLCSFASVRAFADEVDKENERLDILVDNAAMSTKDGAKSVDGWDAMFQANVLAQELLTILLLPKLFQTGEKFKTTPRIVVLSSIVHFWVETDLKALLAQAEGGNESIHQLFVTEPLKVGGGDSYQAHKLLNIFFVRALNSHLPKHSSVQPVPIINSVNPGFCISGLRRNITGPTLEQMQQMEKDFGRTSEEGSRVVLFGAIGRAPGVSAPKGQGGEADGSEDELRGAYLDGTDVMAIWEVSDAALDETGVKVQKLLWDEMVKIFEGIDDRVGPIVAKYLKN